MNSPSRWVIGGAAALVALSVATGSAGAQSELSGPYVELERYEVSPGETVEVRVGGFDSNAVTINVCGNEARRGSGDCNVSQGEGRRLDPNADITVALLPISSPPMPCPCVVRVSTGTNDQVAVAPITLVGHPIAPVVGSIAGEPLDVSIVANPMADGLSQTLRTGLGGATPYEVTVTVRNRSTAEVDGLRMSGAVSSRGDDAAVLDLPSPPAIGPGQTWQQTIDAELPAPAWGDAEWQVTVSGSGPAVTATDSSRNFPWLLVILVAVLVVDVALIAWRVATRNKRKRREEEERQPQQPTPPSETIFIPTDEAQPVG